LKDQQLKGKREESELEKTSDTQQLNTAEAERIGDNIEIAETIDPKVLVTLEVKP